MTLELRDVHAIKHITQISTSILHNLADSRTLKIIT